jgi:UDP-N-acetylmuramoyl-tripeptide--D-alanyl-D-alanine ligase
MMDTAEAARAVSGQLHGANVRFTGVTTDSRGIRHGELFVALKGERFDAHDFIEAAEKKGAVAALVSRLVVTNHPALRDHDASRLPQIVVDDTRFGLGRLAAYWRRRFALPVIALTGSNGKTTVKEMLAAILTAHCGTRETVLATAGNLNNDIGMPLTLLRLRDGHRFAVVEMGMNHAGEIDYLSRIAQPTVAIVNNAQRAHVGILGSVEAIAHAKGEIYGGLVESGIAVINEDDAFAPLWKKLNAGRRIVTFGLNETADVRATASGSQVRIVTPVDAFAVTLQVAGEHNVRNALAACAAAHALEIPPHAMQDGLSHFEGVPGRLQRRRGAGGSVVIDDSYNANPESMKAAVRVLADEPGRRIFVMGDMGELGSGAESMHAEIGAFAKELGIEALLALGDLARDAVIGFGKGAAHFTDIESLQKAAREMATSGTTLLVKGSRFMQMERVADALAEGGDADAV